MCVCLGVHARRGAIHSCKVPWSRADRCKTRLGAGPRETQLLLRSAPGCLSTATSCKPSLLHPRGGWGGNSPTVGLVLWLLEKGQTNGEPTTKAASSSEAVLQLPGNNLDSYSCHHLVHASFLISFGSSRCHRTKGELALCSTLCLT